MKSLATCLALALTAYCDVGNAQCTHPRPKPPIVKLPNTPSLKGGRVCPIKSVDRPLSLRGGAMAKVSQLTPHASWSSRVWPWFTGCTATMPTPIDHHR